MATGPSATTIFANTLDVLKGWSPYMVDKQAPLDPALTPSAVRAGMVVHIDPTLNAFKLGAAGAEVPIFLRNSGDDNDTNPFLDVQLGNSSLQGQTFGSKGPILSGVVGIDGFELETTEYDGSPIIGALLTADTSVSTTAGKVVTATGAVSVCGIVTKAPSENHNGVLTIKFWTHFQISAALVP